VKIEVWWGQYSVQFCNDKFTGLITDVQWTKFFLSLLHSWQIPNVGFVNKQASYVQPHISLDEVLTALPLADP